MPPQHSRWGASLTCMSTSFSASVCADPVCCAHSLAPDGRFLRALPLAALRTWMCLLWGLLSPWRWVLWMWFPWWLWCVARGISSVPVYLCCVAITSLTQHLHPRSDPQILCLLPQGPLEMPLFLRCSGSESLLPSRGLSFHRTGLSNQLVPTEYIRIQRLWKYIIYKVEVLANSASSPSV